MLGRDAHGQGRKTAGGRHGSGVLVFTHRVVQVALVVDLSLVAQQSVLESQKQKKRSWTRRAVCDTTPRGRGEPGGSGKGECVNRILHRSPRSRHRRAQKARHIGRRSVIGSGRRGFALQGYPLVLFLYSSHIIQLTLQKLSAG